MSKPVAKDILLIEELQLSLKEKEEILLLYFNIKNFVLKVFLNLLTNKHINFDKTIFYLDLLESNNNFSFSKLDSENILKIRNIKNKDFNFLEKESKTLQENENIAEKVIKHLNKLTNKQYRSETYFPAINSLIKQGFALQDFYNVHFYYLYLWGLDEKMFKYVRPSTLYRKFEERVIEANTFWGQLKAKKQEINECLEVFNGLEKFYFEKILGEEITKEVSNKFNSKDIRSYVLNIKRRELILNWIEKGYSPDDIKLTISIYFNKYGNQPEILPHITLEKILDNKFPARVEGAKKIKLITDNYTLNKEDVGDSSLITEWLNNFKKKEKK